jgi:hypothetical protein
MMNTLSNHSHNQTKYQYTHDFTWLKPSKRETIHNHSQCDHLRQHINAKEKYVHKSFSQSIFNK